MANQRATAALLLIASLFMAVAISGAHARPAHGGGYVLESEHESMSHHTEEHHHEPVEGEHHPEPEEEEKPRLEPGSELTCHCVHGVKEGETCCSVWTSAGLTEEKFLSFNPNLCCENLFVGQWVCLEATSSCHHECPEKCHEKCPEKCPEKCHEKCPEKCPEECPEKCPEKCPSHKECPEECPSHEHAHGDEHVHGHEEVDGHE